MDELAVRIVTPASKELGAQYIHLLHFLFVTERTAASLRNGERESGADNATQKKQMPTFVQPVVKKNRQSTTSGALASFEVAEGLFYTVVSRIPAIHEQSSTSRIEISTKARTVSGFGIGLVPCRSDITSNFVVKSTIQTLGQVPTIALSVLLFRERIGLGANCA